MLYSYNLVTDSNAKHILIVEDSADLQALLAQLFEGEGYSLSHAYNGREALDLLRTMKSPPSLILLDIMMPVMDGIEFLKQQKSDPRFSAIPVVVMSADSKSQSNTKQWCEAFVQKPILDVNKLVDLVERLRSFKKK